MAIVKKVFIVDSVELACRIAEAVTGKSRPSGMSAADFIAYISPDARDQLFAQVGVVTEYFREIVSAAETVQ